MKINTSVIQEIVYNLAKQSAINVNKDVYRIFLEEYKKNPTTRLKNILNNIKKSDEKERPLCQDTGSVHVFLKIGKNVNFIGGSLSQAINDGIEKCYKENFFRKSIIENALFSGKNTETNTPVSIDTEIIDSDEAEIYVFLKGAGSDNMSSSEMLLPSTSMEKFKEYLIKKILDNGKNACPPLFVSVAVGTTAKDVLNMAEKGFFNKNKNQNQELKKLEEEIKSEINKLAPQKYNEQFIFDLKINTYPHHIASLPVGIAINCHSLRYAKAVIKADTEIIYEKTVSDFISFDNSEKKKEIKEIDTSETEKIRNLKEGEEVLLSGEILIARDAAHKKTLEKIQNNEKMNFTFDNKIVFYASPCPPKNGEITGPIGPTTSRRMDKFLKYFPNILATIGKGPRSQEAEDIIRQNNSVYFEVEGGIATLLADKFTDLKIIDFEELSTEAVYLAKIKQLPVKVSISKNR